METRASYILVGLFVLGLLGASAVWALWLARPQVASAVFYVVRFDENVTGLRVGGDVRFHGVRVGEIERIRIDGETEQVEVKIQVDEGTPVRQSTVARLEMQGITGATFIQLRRQKDGAGGDDSVAGTATAPHPEIPAELSALAEVFEQIPLVLAQIKSAAAQMAELLSDDNLESISQSLENINRMSENLSGQGDAISGMFTKAQNTLETAERALVAIEGLTGKVDGAITDVRKAVVTFDRMGANIDDFITENRRPVSDFSATGLYEMTQFLIESRELIQTLTRITAKLESDPARFLFGDTLKGYEAQ